MKYICPYCHESITDDMNFCASCGNRLRQMNKKQTVIIFPIVIVILSILISLVFVFKNDSTNDQNTIKMKRTQKTQKIKKKRNKYKFKMAYK